MEKIKLQKAEFDAVAALCKAYDALPPIVDDDYPAMRHRYESVMRDLVKALIANGRIPREATQGALTFTQLRLANAARLPLFKNGRGKPAHRKPDGSDWKLSTWMNAILGELGEAANIVKKIERGDYTLEEALPALSREFADVLIYLDITAAQAGVELGDVTRVKFNETSAKIGVNVTL